MRRFTTRPRNVRDEPMKFRAVVHPVSRHGIRACWFVRRASDQPWIFVGEMIMATAEWEAYRASLAPEIEVYPGSGWTERNAA